MTLKDGTRILTGEPPADMAQFNDLYIGAEQQPTVTVGHRCGSPRAPCDLMQ